METRLIPVGISNRHLHLSLGDLETLFGSGYRLKEMKPLSQPGQFAAEETVTIAGPKGKIDKVRILGPERKASQVEISQTDAYKLGISAPVRDSGDIKGTPGLTLIGPKGEVALDAGAILACRHIHMTVGDSRRLGVRDKDRVKVKTNGDRACVFENVLVRVSDSFFLEMHLDTDEANASLLRNGENVRLCLTGD
ncbi:MAG TPA: propanediol utilization protein [Cyanobacteria bacterium UBA8530]|nr:propanediol utilization protein [Cyanobacteria bacterium UBA8530]